MTSSSATDTGHAADTTGHVRIERPDGHGHTPLGGVRCLAFRPSLGNRERKRLALSVMAYRQCRWVLPGRSATRGALSRIVSIAKGDSGSTTHRHGERP